MSFALERFVELRPFLFHLTFSENLESILHSRHLYPAAYFLKAESRLDGIGTRRKSHLALNGTHGKIFIRDQSPLKEGHVSWEAGWDMPRFVGHLNQHVFFWPGGPEGPILYGRNHLERYRKEKPVLLKIPTAGLIDSRSKPPAMFCPWNSGAPRISNGKKCPRGSRTFLSAQEADFTAGKAVEVAFRGKVDLPYTFEYLDGRDGIWRVNYASCIQFDDDK